MSKEVAVKTFTVIDGNPSNYTKGEIAWHHYQSANTEGRIMASLQHPNILPLVGIVFQPIRLLLEFAPLGSLKNIVNRYYDNSLRIGRYALQKVISQVRGVAWVCTGCGIIHLPPLCTVIISNGIPSLQ